MLSKGLITWWASAPRFEDLIVLCTICISLFHMEDRVARGEGGA